MTIPAAAAQGSTLTFPILECFHIIGYACGIGTITLLDFRLLGFVLEDKSLALLWRDTLFWTLGGIALAMTAGLMLFSTDPDMYYLNYVFNTKMAVLLAALIFHFTAVRKAALGGGGKAVAVISLVLWAAVLAGGIFTAFV